MVYVQNPGSVNMNFCTFRHATVILQHINASIIQNCEFSQTDSAAITVEGYPKEDKSWTYASMISKIMATCTLHQKPERQKSGETVPKSAISSTAISLSTATAKQKSAKLSCDTQQMSNESESKSHEHEVRSCDNCTCSKEGELGSGAVGGNPNNLAPDIKYNLFGSQNSSVSGIIEDNAAGQSIHSLNTCKSTAQCVNKSDIKIKFDAYLVPGYTTAAGDGMSTSTNCLHHDSDKIARIHNFVSDCAKYSNSDSLADSTIDCEGDTLSQSLSHAETSKSERRLSYELAEACVNNCNETGIIVPSLELHLPEVKEDDVSRADGEGNDNDGDGTLRERSLSSSEVSLHSASGSDVEEDEQQRGFMSGSFTLLQGHVHYTPARLCAHALFFNVPKIAVVFHICHFYKLEIYKNSKELDTSGNHCNFPKYGIVWYTLQKCFQRMQMANSIDPDQTVF